MCGSGPASRAPLRLQTPTENNRSQHSNIHRSTRRRSHRSLRVSCRRKRLPSRRPLRVKPIVRAIASGSALSSTATMTIAKSAMSVTIPAIATGSAIALTINGRRTAETIDLRMTNMMMKATWSGFRLSVKADRDDSVTNVSYDVIGPILGAFFRLGGLSSFLCFFLPLHI